MPQDKKANLVKLNRLPINLEQVGKLALKLHEMQRRAYEGTQPIEDLFPILDDFNNLPKTDPQLHAARKAAEKLPDDAKMRALTHIALASQEKDDAVKACAQFAKMKNAEAANLFFSLYLAMPPDVSERLLNSDPLGIVALPENFNFWAELEKAKSDDARAKDASLIQRGYCTIHDYEDWKSKTAQVLSSKTHPLFDEMIFALLRTSERFARSGDEDLVNQLLARLSNGYKRAEALLRLGRIDDVRRQVLADLERGTDDFHPEATAEQVLDMLLVASLVFGDSGEPEDLYFIGKLLRHIGQFEHTNIVSDPAFNNLAAIADFHRFFWQNIAAGFVPAGRLGEIARKFVEKCGNAISSDAVTLFHPSHWLFMFLGRHFGFRDELAQSEGRSDLYDPEKYFLPRSQKITAYLQIAKWRGGGDDFAKDALERAYNHALELEDSFYKVVLLCEIFALKMEYKLYR